MNKVAVLKIGKGSIDSGFALSLTISNETCPPEVEITGELPPAANIFEYYQRWLAAYWSLNQPYRLEAKKGFVTNVSYLESCETTAELLKQKLNDWLNQPQLRIVKEKLLEKLQPTDNIRVLIQTDNPQLQKIPWHLWELWEKFPQAEIALSHPHYELKPQAYPAKEQVRILAILGSSRGIDTTADRQLLEQLPSVELQFLVEPSRKSLTETLWDKQGWDILFFAGHSNTNSDQNTGCIYLNQDDSLTISELKYAIKQAAKGLRIAIFNSCDGLGLAKSLAQLNIGQILFMREPIGDRVASEFLKYFLLAYRGGESFYLAVKQAREKLQGLEDKYPCATWLPVIYQNPAVVPPSWQDLLGKPSQPTTAAEKNDNFWGNLIASLTIAAVTIALRYLGVFQPLELITYDYFTRLQPKETTDPRILIVSVTETDVQAQNSTIRRGSLADSTLLAILQKLQPHQPRVVGIDIYRDFPVLPELVDLKEQLQQPNLVGVCKISDRTLNHPGISPPPEIDINQIGFSDLIADSDNRIRRQLLAMTPEAASPCQAAYSFNTQIALRYLASEGILPEWRADGNLQLGDTVLSPLQNHRGGYHTVDSKGHQILLNYRNTEHIAMEVTVADLLEGRVNPEFIGDRIVLIGTTAPSFLDYWETPQDHSISGVHLQAHQISQIISAVLDQRALISTLSFWQDSLLILIWTVIPVVAIQICPRNFIMIATITIIIGGSCYILLAYRGVWLPLVPPLLGVTASLILIKPRSSSRKS